MAEVGMVQLAGLQQHMTDQQKMVFMTQYNAARKERTTALILSVLFGYLGADRFYVGDTALGFFKLFTVGGLGIWAFIDWFLIMGRTDQLNWERAQEIAMLVAPRPDAGPTQDSAPPAPPGAAAPAAVRAQAAAPQRSTTLVALKDGQEIGRYPVAPGESISIGRDAASAVGLADQRVSSNHAKIEFAAGGTVILRDLDSTNGTFVGQQRINGAVRINPGTAVRFGDTTVTFSW